MVKKSWACPMRTSWLRWARCRNLQQLLPQTVPRIKPLCKQHQPLKHKELKQKVRNKALLKSKLLKRLQPLRWPRKLQRSLPLIKPPLLLVRKLQFLLQRNQTNQQLSPQRRLLKLHQLTTRHSTIK